MKITIWNEDLHHERRVEKAYPQGMNAAVASIFDGADDISVTTATLADSEQGLPKKLLDETDVLIWWGHMGHDKVNDELVDRIYKRVVDEGMGLICLHSAHFSKIFKKLNGTPCDLRWREIGEAERVWTLMPDHPIAYGVEQGFRLPHEEMYGEPFNISTPDAIIFAGWFAGGEIFKSGCLFTRGKGKIFYFQPGHETFPIYYDKNVRKVIFNAADFVGNRNKVKKEDIVIGSELKRPRPLEKIPKRWF